MAHESHPPRKKDERLEAETGTKRRHPRYRVGGRGHLTVGSPQIEAPVQLIDISIGGASLRCDKAITTSAAGQLVFSVLCDGTDVSAAPKVVVRYCVLDGSRYRVGIEFVDPDAQTEKALSLIIDSRKRIVWGH